MKKISVFKLLQILFIGAFLGFVSICPDQIFAQSTVVIERVSLDSAGNEANAPSSRNDINADGRYVVFASLASNLIDGDTNGFKDIFLHDRQESTTIRVSVSSGGTQSNGPSDAPVISADGRYIAYESYATNLVSGDTNDKSDIFLYDTQTGITIRVSEGTGGVQANDHSFYPALSSDGSYVAFQSAATNLVAVDVNAARDIFRRNLNTGVTELVSVDTGGGQANGDSLHPTLSKDGRYIAFTSAATNLVTRDDNGVTDIFLRDCVEEVTMRVTDYAWNIDPLELEEDWEESNGASSFPSIDDDGTFIAFESIATNLVQGDTNAVRDIFVYNRSTDETIRVSVNSDGTQANWTSGDGVDEQSLTISGNGQYVVFKSRATNLVNNDTNGVVDVFIYDRESFITQRMSVNTLNEEANHVSYYPSVSYDGEHVVFYSYASNLVVNDHNGYGDIFVYNRDAVTATATPSPTITVTPMPTPIGNQIVVTVPRNTTSPTEIDFVTDLGVGTIRCESVTDGGTLTITVYSTLPSVIGEFEYLLRQNYDIVANGLVCENINLCLPYILTEEDMMYVMEEELRLYHYYDSTWSDITTYNDTSADRVCGNPPAFSPFVIGVSEAMSNPVPTSELTPTPSGPTPTIELPKSGFVESTNWLIMLLMFIVGVGILFLV